jgi:transcriptional regulator with XRE-family HTH domain
MIYKLGSKIRILRKEAGLTQEQLAEMVNVSVNFIGYIERGERAPSIYTVEQLAQALNVDLKDLFEFSVDEYEYDLSIDTLVAALRKCAPDDLQSLIHIAKQLGSR